jgi:type II secretory pathway pseudopilin PulG
MELLAVVAIIVIIAGAAVIAVPGIIEGTKVSRAKADCKTLANAIRNYLSLCETNQNMPQLTDGDWTPLVTMQGTQKALLERSAIEDPWRQSYHFALNQSETGAPKVWSTGPPGTPQEINNFQK